MSKCLGNPSILAIQVEKLNASFGCTDSKEAFVQVLRTQPTSGTPTMAKAFRACMPKEPTKMSVYAAMVPLVKTWFKSAYAETFPVRESSMKLLMVSGGKGQELPHLTTRTVVQNIQSVERTTRSFVWGRINDACVEAISTGDFSAEEIDQITSGTAESTRILRSISGAADDGGRIIAFLAALQAKDENGHLVSPDDFTKNVAAAYDDMESMLDFNIRPQKILDGLIAAGVNPFRRVNPVENQHSVECTPPVMRYMKDITDFGFGEEDPLKHSDDELFRIVGSSLQRHVFEDASCSDTAAMEEYVREIRSEVLREMDLKEANTRSDRIDVNISLRRKIYREIMKRDSTEAPSWIRKSIAAAYGVQEILQAHLKTGETCACPLKYSGKAKQWYDLHSAPIVDWYRQAFTLREVLKDE